MRFIKSANLQVHLTHSTDVEFGHNPVLRKIVGGRNSSMQYSVNYQVQARVSGQPRLSISAGKISAEAARVNSQ